MRRATRFLPTCTPFRQARRGGEALRERGFERELIAQIMARTIARVGASDCSAEHWLAIALRYANGLSA
jgi:hypothetical protein